MIKCGQIIENLYINHVIVSVWGFNYALEVLMIEGTVVKAAGLTICP